MKRGRDEIKEGGREKEREGGKREVGRGEGEGEYSSWQHKGLLHQHTIFVYVCASMWLPTQHSHKHTSCQPPRVQVLRP